MLQAPLTAILARSAEWSADPVWGRYFEGLYAYTQGGSGYGAGEGEVRAARAAVATVRNTRARYAAKGEEVGDILIVKGLLDKAQDRSLPPQERHRIAKLGYIARGMLNEDGELPF